MTSYTTLHVENFKGIREMKLDGLGMVNVFVGDNNVGKTSVLQAIHLGSFLDFNDRQLRDDLATNPHLRKVTPNDMARQMIRSASQFWGEQKNAEDLLYLGSLNNAWSITINGHQAKFSQYDFFSNNHSRKKQKIQVGTDQHGNVVFMMKAYEHQFLPTHIFPEIKKDISFLYQIMNYAIEHLKKPQLVEALKPLQTNLITIDLLDKSIGCQLSGANKLLNIKEMGEGFLKLALIKALLLSVKTPYIFIDEIENGFHYSVQKDMWRMILQAAKDDGTQFFFTTHSYEVLESLNDVLKEMKEKGESLKVIPKDSGTPTDPLDLACVFELEKSSDDVVSYTKYHGLSLEGAIINGVEIRGRKDD